MDVADWPAGGIFQPFEMKIKDEICYIAAKPFSLAILIPSICNRHPPPPT